MMRHNMGRDAYMAWQGGRFDRDYANPTFIAIDMLVCIIMLAILIGIYELIAFVVSKTVESLDDSQDS